MTVEEEPRSFPYFLFGLVGISTSLFIGAAALLLPVVSDNVLPAWLRVLNLVVAMFMLSGGIGVLIKTNLGRYLLIAGFAGFMLVSLLSTINAGFTGSTASWFGRAFGLVVALGVIALLATADESFQ